MRDIIALAEKAGISGKDAKELLERFPYDTILKALREGTIGELLRHLRPPGDDAVQL